MSQFYNYEKQNKFQNYKEANILKNQEMINNTRNNYSLFPQIHEHQKNNDSNTIRKAKMLCKYNLNNNKYVFHTNMQDGKIINLSTRKNKSEFQQYNRKSIQTKSQSR